MANTGENEQGLRKILDMTRMMSIAIMLLHFYYFCYGAFKEWELTYEISDNLLRNIQRSGLYTNIQTSKVISVILLTISLLGAKGRKKEQIRMR